MTPEILEQLRSTDPESMEEVGRALGHHLAVTADREVRDWRRGLREATRAVEDPFALGFATALAMVVRGFEARRARDDEDAAAIETACAHRVALEMIEHREDVIPKTLAKALDVAMGDVTLLLKDLERARLVAPRLAAESEDRRTRPRRITPYGRVILGKLRAGTSVGPIRGVVHAIVRAMVQLEDGREPRQRILDTLRVHLEPREADVALDALVEALRVTGTGFVDDDDTLLLPGVELRRQLRELLVEAKNARTKDEAPLVSCLESLSADGTLLVRVTNGDDDWDHVVTRWFRDDRVAVVRDDELNAAWVKRHLSGRFAVLYSSAATMLCDLESTGASWLEGASGRYLFGNEMLAAALGVNAEATSMEDDESSEDDETLDAALEVVDSASNAASRVPIAAFSMVPLKSVESPAPINAYRS